MAVYDLEEQDQIDDLKAWWARYGGTVAVGLILAFLLIGGVQGWRWWNGKRAEDASVLYSAVSEAARTKDAAKAKDAVAQITDRYAGTGYAPRAALLYAKMLYDAGDRDGARAQLSWVVDHTTEEELKAVGRYRLAQVQADAGQYDATLATLDARHPDAFDGVYADLRGDALAAAGRPADARAAYEVALAKLDAKSPYRNFVQVKHDALGGNVKAASNAPPANAAAATPVAAPVATPVAAPVATSGADAKSNRPAPATGGPR